MMGDYGIQAVSDLLLAKRYETHATDRADLAGKRSVCTIEVDEGKKLAKELMKQLTGGDKVRARFLFENNFEFVPTWKIFLAANHKPTISSQDYAVWRRIKLVPFTQTIAPHEKDPCSTAKLLAELPGMLALAVRGCLEWQRIGLAEPEEVTIATDARQSGARLARPMDGRMLLLWAGCEVQTGCPLWILHRMVQEDWRGGCIRQGIHKSLKLAG